MSEIKQITRAGAKKMVRKLEDDKDYLLSQIASQSNYIETEGIDPVVPDFDFDKVITQWIEIDSEIRKIKQALNIFDTNAIIPELNITISEALIKMAQLNKLKTSLDSMRRKIPKKRRQGYNVSNNLVEYECLNYDLKQAEAAYDAVLADITKIQIGLDTCSQTLLFDLEI